MQPTLNQENLQSLAQDVLKQAKKQGATAAEAYIVVEKGFSVNVRLGEVETVEYNQDKALGLTVYFGQQKGNATTTDLHADSINETVKAACDIARYTQEDPYAGLADADLMAKEIPDLDLNYPWDIDPERAIEIALECEATALSQDDKITNSDGASIATQWMNYVHANTNGFVGAFPSTSHNIFCMLLGQDGADMQRDYYYTTARDAHDLESVTDVAHKAAERTLRRLGARTIKTCKVPVIFEAQVASGLLSSFISAIRGTSLTRKSSFLLDKLGEQIFPDHIDIYERPHMLKTLGSAPFDNDGLATRDQNFIEQGVLQRYALGVYSARKLNLEPTANAGGVRNLFISTSDMDLQALAKKMDKGVLITELMGQGINIVTGDYSRGATGFWVENGKIQYPVQGFTVAANLKDMFRNLVAVGNDVDMRGNYKTGSILLEEVTIAGD